MSNKLETIAPRSTANSVERRRQSTHPGDYANSPRSNALSKPQGTQTASPAHHREEEEEETFFEQYGTALIVGSVVMLTLGAAVFYAMTGESTPVRKPTNTVVSIQLPPPPPPPPKVQPPPPPPEQKMIEQPPLDQPEEKAEAKPVDEPPALGTNIKGGGPSLGGLGSSGNGGTGLGSSAANRRGGPFDRYAGQVQNRIQEALRNHRQTRNANLRVEVCVWPDQAGRITRAQLVSSTGDAAVDNALKNEVLVGLQLQEPPPRGMPTPIVLRVTARRPG